MTKKIARPRLGKRNFILASFGAILTASCGRTPAPSTAPQSTAQMLSVPAAQVAKQAENAGDSIAMGAELMRATDAYVLECFGDEKAKIAISKMMVQGDTAVAIVEILSVPELRGELSLVFMNRSSGKWRGVDYGSGLEPPEWYPHW